MKNRQADPCTDRWRRRTRPRKVSPAVRSTNDRHPLSIPKSFKAEIKEAIDKVDPKFMQEIEDASSGVHVPPQPVADATAHSEQQRSRPWAEVRSEFPRGDLQLPVQRRWKGRYRSEGRKEVQASIASGDTTIDKAQAIDPTGIIGTLRELVSPAYRKKLDDSRKFMASLQNTNADIDAARQSMDVDAPGEVSFMIRNRKRS